MGRLKVGLTPEWRSMQVRRLMPITHGMRSGPLRIGQDFGPRYHVLKLLGSGGMGVVYQALDRELGEDIALKVLRAPARAAAGSLAEMQRRFRAELVLARKVTHKHVIRIHDIGEIDGIKFISMPLVKGKDLAAILADGPLPVDRALDYARQIAAGLVAVHAAGVIHRDLKPSNIMIDEHDQVLLMDFGIARPNAPAGQPRTIAGAIVGTTAYMAPEQARGEAVDPRTDVYGFGLILYEMLCGIRPSLTINELLARMKAPPTPAHHVNAAVPLELDSVVTRCLKPGAADRYQTSAEVAEALSDLHGGRKRRPVAVPWRGWLPRIAALLVLAALAGLGYGLLEPGHAARTAAKAQKLGARALDRVTQLNPAEPVIKALEKLNPVTLLAREEDGDTPAQPSSAGPPPSEPTSGSYGDAHQPRPDPADRQRHLARTTAAPDAHRRPAPAGSTSDRGRAFSRHDLAAGTGLGAGTAGRGQYRPDGRAIAAMSTSSALPPHLSVSPRLELPLVPTASAHGSRRGPMMATTDTGNLQNLQGGATLGDGSVLQMLEPPRAAFSAGTIDRSEAPERHSRAAQIHRPARHWLDRILPIRTYRAPMPAKAEDEFQVCYINSVAE
jgi:hypothetical protein